MKIEVLYVEPESPGYHPVSHMARLAAKVLGGELVIIKAARAGMLQRLSSFVPRRRHEYAGILICPQPGVMASILSVDDWRRKYGILAAWIFDSFWTDYIPRFVRISNVFDRIYVTELEDLDTWRKRTGAPVEWLPWGSDTLDLGNGSACRPIDLLRFGRQPPEWDDDNVSRQASATLNLNFHGRPPSSHDPGEGQRLLMEKLGQAKFTLSFSNRVSPSGQTHPRREYVTGRWTDALSAGAVVAGVPPNSETARTLLWDGALLDIGTIEREKGLAVIAEAVRDWKPAHAQANYLHSLEVLDWRWRFEKIADSLKVHPPALKSSLAHLHQTIEGQRQALAFS